MGAFDFHRECLLTDMHELQVDAISVYQKLNLSSSEKINTLLTKRLEMYAHIKTHIEADQPNTHKGE